MSDEGFDTRGLRYSRPGGYPTPKGQQPEAWDCPKCGRHNARYLAQCGQCLTPRPKEKRR